MTEEATTETTEETTTEEEKTEQTVPYSRFKEVNDRVKAAETAAAEAAAQLKAREEAELSEKEKAEKAAQEAISRAEAAEARATELERSSWVRAAASDFNDPDDAVAMLNLSELDSAEKAAEAVKDLGKNKPHLVKDQKPAKIGSPLDGGKKHEVPTGADGKPDEKLGLGQELMTSLFGGKSG